MTEARTAGIAARHLEKNGYKVTTGIGGTGVVGVLVSDHGDGHEDRPVVMLRADMDALLIQESTHLKYSSTAMYLSRTLPYNGTEA